MYMLEVGRLGTLSIHTHTHIHTRMHTHTHAHTHTHTHTHAHTHTHTHTHKQINKTCARHIQLLFNFLFSTGQLLIIQSI